MSEVTLDEATVESDGGVSGEKVLYGVMGEFGDDRGLLVAARAVRDAGFSRWDCFTPFAVHGLDRAMGLKPTRLPWLVFGCGAMGAGAGVVLTWWVSATGFNLPAFLRGYPVLVSGKPMLSLPAFIPIIFELTILLAALGAVVGMLALNGLPRLHHPVFRSSRFRRATDDRYFVVVEADDPRFEAAEVEALLRQAGAAAVERLED